MEYTIKSGDTLCGIAKKVYGIQNNAEAYQKALEIAKANGIQNPNLIFAGHSLTLEGVEDKPVSIPEKPAGDSFETENDKDDIESQYAQLQAQMKGFYQYVKANSSNPVKEDDFALQSDFDPKKDGEFSFVDSNVFSLPTEQKVAGYKEGVLNIANQEITKFDTGNKDGKLDFNEFSADFFDSLNNSSLSLEAQGRQIDTLNFFDDVFEDKDLTKGIGAQNAGKIRNMLTEIQSDDSTYKDVQNAGETDYEKTVQELLEKYPNSDAGVLFVNFIMNQVQEEGITDANYNDVKGLILAFTRLDAKKSVYDATKAEIGAQTQATFQMYDLNKDGFVDASEIGTTYILNDISETGNPNATLQMQGSDYTYYLDGKIDVTHPYELNQGDMSYIHNIFFSDYGNSTES